MALEKFCKLPVAENYIYHDNWMYSVCCFLGSVCYDTESKIKYRQTGKNVSGKKKTGLAIWKQRLKKLYNLSDDMRIYESIAKNLSQCFSNEIKPSDLQYLKRIMEYRKNLGYKLYLLVSKRMKTRSVSKNICIKGRILINKL